MFRLQFLNIAHLAICKAGCFSCFLDTTVSFQELLIASNVYKTLMSFATFLVTLGLLHILRYNRTIAIMAATLTGYGSQLASFGVYFLIILSAFASLTHCCFGARLYDFRNLWSTLTRLAIRHMHMEYEETREEAGVFGAVVMLVFCFFTLVVLINMVVTIINDALTALKTSGKETSRDHEVINYMFSLLTFNKEAPPKGLYLNLCRK